MEDKDIEILESFLDKNVRKFVSPKKYKFLVALENLLQAYKKDEKIIDEMAKVICKFDCIPSKVTNYKDLIDYFRKKCE